LPFARALTMSVPHCPGGPAIGGMPPGCCAPAMT
jgi:hypothetical protein